MIIVIMPLPDARFMSLPVKFVAADVRRLHLKFTK